MAKKIKNFKDLFNKIEDDMKDSMNDVGKEVSETTKKVIDDVAYASGEPKEYERTYQLRDSITNFPAEVVGNTVAVEIDHDTSMIIYNQDKYQHGSYLYTPNDISEFIDIIVHEGLSGDLFGNGYWREERQYFDVTVHDLIVTGEHIKHLKNSMERKGYKFKD